MTPWLKRTLGVLLVAGAMLVHLGSSALSRESATASVTLCFAPDAEAKQELVSRLDAAQKSIYLAMDVLTDADLKEALKRCLRRSVAVHLLLDGRMTGDRHDWTRQGLYAAELQANGAELRLSTGNRPLQSRFAVIDARWVLTGSMTWSPGDSHATLVVLDASALAQDFLRRWRTLN